MNSVQGEPVVDSGNALGKFRAKGEKQVKRVANLAAFWRPTILAALSFPFFVLPARGQSLELTCPSQTLPANPSGLLTTLNFSNGKQRQHVCVDNSGNLLLMPEVFITPGTSSPPLSASGQGIIYFDSAAGIYKVSQNGGPYVNLLSSGSGTVTSVGITQTGNVFNITNSPITTAGNINLAFANESANTLFGNCTGGTATPSFCALTDAMLPATLAGHTISGGTLSGSFGGSPTFTGISSFTAGETDVKRLKANQGTALVAGDFALSAGWGSTGAVSAVTGTDQAWNITITSGGTGIATAPTVTLTFHDGTWTNSPLCLAKMMAGTGAISDITGLPSATAWVMTYQSLPVSGQTYIITGICIGR
jgi:hypothetical protein